MNNLAPIGISTYSRINHLKKTVNALKNNKLAKKSVLYIFSDAPKKGDEKKIEKVRNYIKTIYGFKEVNIVERETNNRTFNNRDGIESLLEKYGKMIWLEEDIVTASGFLTFLNEALKFYKDNKKVLSVTGYTPPINIPDNFENDFFILKRFSAWGFATWEEKFNPFNFNIDENNIEDFFNNKEQIKRFKENGPDMFNMLKKEYSGELDALDVKIMFHQFINNQYTIYPKKSLVQNIGHDGSGLHCGSNDMFYIKELWDKEKNFEFKNKLSVDKRIKKENYKFRSLDLKDKLIEILKQIKIFPILKKMKDRLYE